MAEILPDQVRLLMVDDDAAYVELARAQFSHFQGPRIDITSVQEGRKALEHLKNGTRFEIIAVDYNLPDMNGLQLIESMRNKEITTPIVLLSAEKDVRLAIAAIKLHVEDYIVKNDIGSQSLPSMIAAILERTSLKRKFAEQFKEDFIARRKNDAIKELVVTVCHEFNNPLAAMKISTDILLRQQLPPREMDLVFELDKNIRLIEMEITRLRDLNYERLT